MLFKIDPRIFQNNQGLRVGIVVARNVSNSLDNQIIQDIFKKQQELVVKSMAKDSVDQHPYILAWREAYKKFGSSPKKYLSSIENLIARLIKQTSLRSINPLVDIYNTVSLTYMLPAGAEDLGKIAGDIELTYAGEHEKPITLLGDNVERAPEMGEVIYKDRMGAICRKFNWKEADRTKVTPESTNVIVVFEALNTVADDVLQAAVAQCAYLLKTHIQAQVGTFIFDEQHPQVDLDTLPILSTITVPECKRDLYHMKVHQEVAEHVHDSAETHLRIEKVKKMREMGIEPWPAAREITAHAQDVLGSFQEGDQKEYTLAGRVMTIRLHGKTAFADLVDGSGRIQLYFKQETVGDSAFDFFKHFIDLGDIIWVTGAPFKTKMGEITVAVSAFGMLSKCLHPLPEKFHGIADIEIKYRQRYLDMISSQETKNRFIKRSSIIKSLRSFLDEHNYIEVETPMLHPIAGGAAARPFVTHHNALNSQFYLRIAPELYLKRLVIGGFERVYEINRNFRNEGVSTRHNPEFTMLEFYTAHKDYQYAMDVVEQMLRNAAMKANGILQVQYGERTLDFEKPFRRLRLKDAVKEYVHVTDADLSESGIDALILKHGVKLPHAHASLAEKMYALFEEHVESQLIQPTFIIDFPIEISPLAKRDPQNPSIASRFELFVAGMEIANSFNELNEPFDQAQRFHDQLKAFQSGNEEAHQFDADFIHAIEYGLPPTVGVGIGIDRLVMLVTNTTSIKEVILFPTLKKKDV